MKILELIYVVPYLPYGLKIHTQFGVNVPKNGHIYTVIGVCQKRTVFLDSDIVFEVEEKFNKELSHYYNEFKPLLRPLSDLTKEIEVNGDVFVPIERLFEIENPQHASKGRKYYYTESPRFITCSGNWCSIETKINIIETKCIPYWIGEKLNEWHFDWKEDLIEQGLAIDLNTIK